MLGGTVVAAIEQILHGDYVFAVQRHEQLADALGLPAWSVGYGYGYAARGELNEEIGAGKLIYVGGRPT